MALAAGSTESLLPAPCFLPRSAPCSLLAAASADLECALLYGRRTLFAGHHPPGRPYPAAPIHRQRRGHFDPGAGPRQTSRLWEEFFPWQGTRLPRPPLPQGREWRHGAWSTEHRVPAPCSLLPASTRSPLGVESLRAGLCAVLSRQC